jgi:hypothetical protein
MRTLFISAQIYILIFSVVNAGDDDVLDLSSNSLDSFKSAIAEHEAILVEFCKYSFT